MKSLGDFSLLFLEDIYALHNSNDVLGFLNITVVFMQHGATTPTPTQIESLFLRTLSDWYMTFLSRGNLFCVLLFVFQNLKGGGGMGQDAPTNSRPRRSRGLAADGGPTHPPIQNPGYGPVYRFHIFIFNYF